MEPAETIEENCGCVRLEWVNRWPTVCELDDNDDDDDDDNELRRMRWPGHVACEGKKRCIEGFRGLT
jgi:hypothetical protein